MSVVERVLSHPLSEIVGWSLIHFVWQGAVLALVLAIVMRGLRRSSASVRYLTACAALTMMAVCPVLTAGWLARDLEWPADIPKPIPFVDVVVPDVAQTEHDIAPAISDEGWHAQSAAMGVARTHDAEPAPPIQSVALDRPLHERVVTAIKPALPWMVGVWLIGVSLLSGRLLIGWVEVQRLRRSAIQPVGESYLETLRQLAVRLRISRPVRLVESALVEVPTVVGWLRPMILLPASAITGLTADQLQAVLAHELAHIRRHDYVVNLLQTVAETLLFYHPAVWWVSHRIRLEREHCCDDIAVQICGDRVAYARMLVTLESLRTPVRLALTASGGSLLNRISRLVGGRPTPHTNRSTWWLAGVLAMTTVAALGLSLYVTSRADELLAENKSEKNEDQRSDERRNRETRTEPATPKPDSYVAELPNGLKVEFVGLAAMDAAPKTWWKPDGTLLGEVPKHDEGTTSVSRLEVRRALFRVHGKLSYLDVITSDMTCSRWDEAHGSGGPFVRVDAAYVFPSAQKTGRIEIGIATQPLSPVRVLNQDGTRAPRAAEAPVDHIVEDIKVTGIFGTKSSNPRIGDKPERGTAIEFVRPVPDGRQFDLDLKLIDMDGKSHDNQQIHGSPPRNETTYLFNVPFDRVARFEYRLRLYRHWVAFENVSLQPGQQTDVKVKVESLPEEKAKPESKEPRFTEALRLELKREAAHDGRWFFVDLDHGRLAKPPFPVELDRTKLPWTVIRPDEAALKKWLIESGVDLVLFAEPLPIAGKPGQWNERTSSWSIRSSRGHVNGLLTVPHVDGQAWRWNDRPELVIAPFARKNEAVNVSGFVPTSSGGPDIRPDSPDLQTFRTAHNVVGFYLLEHNDLATDSLDLAIVHVANATAPLGDLDFDGLHVSGKLGAADPPQSVKPIKADLPDGHSVELVGITKNTRPANAGWRPNGRAIGDVGHWPATTVLHDKNSSTSYAENAPHPEPDADAIDLLFRFQGLKAQPSLVFWTCPRIAGAQRGA